MKCHSKAITDTARSAGQSFNKIQLLASLMLCIAFVWMNQVDESVQIHIYASYFRVRKKSNHVVGTLCPWGMLLFPFKENINTPCLWVLVNTSNMWRPVFLCGTVKGSKAHLRAISPYPITKIGVI